MITGDLIRLQKGAKVSIVVQIFQLRKFTFQKYQGVKGLSFF